MRINRALVLWCIFLCHLHHRAQDYFSYGGSNFGGINQVIANPASAADNRLRFDLVLAGLDVNYNNSWFGVKRDALKRTGGQLPASWQNVTPNVADNMFKNFHFISSPKNRSLSLESRILLPSFLIQLNPDNALAFTWSLRQFFNLDGFSPKLTNLFEREMDLNVTQNNEINLRNVAMVQMSWAEYGMSYARVLKNKEEHFLKAGGTVKILQGLESAFFVAKNLDFLFSTKDESSYFNSNFALATSANLGPNSYNRSKLLSSYYHYVTKPALGLDLGFIYEWRPDYESFKIKVDEKKFTLKRDQVKYRLKIGASVNDIGRIKYQKVGANYDLSVALTASNMNHYEGIDSKRAFDSIAIADFGNGRSGNQFAIALPTAINTQVDFAVTQFFFLNLSTHFGNLYKNNLYNVHNYSAICFAPRLESYWFDLSFPLTYNTLSAKRYKEIMPGINVKIGPFSFGTCDVSPLFNHGDIRAFNVYALVKFTIPQKRVRDRDGDGVKDKEDDCPDTPGEIAFRGCPDSDHDKVPDKSDACPKVAGLPELKGCPDADGDGIKDADDQCPTVKGPLYLYGCPDTDRDSIPDKNDSCPSFAGRRINCGCPDSDRDGIWDKYDNCPKAFGLKKNHGCPDRDNDGVIDKLDACINVPGLAEFHGCPPPPPPIKLQANEKRIIEKAYSNLEFATGKDQIKASSYPYLNALAELLAKHGGEWKIRLSGHTDSEGTPQQNMVLSEKRAKAVKRYLIKHGVPEENFIVEWFGQTRSIADNNTKAGKQKNRRVEMKILAFE